MNDKIQELPRTTEVVRAGIERGFHIGAQWYVSMKSETIADAALGFASLHDNADEALSGRALEQSDLMLWLSASKPIGAVALGQLWEQNRLDIDQPVASIIPEFAQGGKSDITLRHVLTHTGGFRTAQLKDIAQPWDECIALICSSPHEDDWAPGERAGYHDRPAWYIVGECVRRVDGRAYGEYVRDEIFAPLGMNDSWIGMSDSTFDGYDDRIVPTYFTARGARDTQSWHLRESVTPCWPPGNGRGPMRDLAKFYEALLQGGGPNELLQPETINELVSRHRVDLFDETFQHKMDWGLGFIIDSNHYGAKTVPYGYGLHCSSATFGHGGRQSVVSFADPEHDLVVTAAFNGMPGEPRHNTRVREFATAVYEDLGLEKV